MKRHAEEAWAHPELVPATRAQQPILANLLELYAHDFSEFHDVVLGAEGRFGYRNLPLYWSEEHRHPFLVRVAGNWAGLVFVKRGSGLSGNEAVWDMAEFFILRAYRRRAVGTQIAHEVWGRFPGAWEVRVMESNAGAQQFWARAISKFTGGAAPSVSIERDGERWRLFSFESIRRA